MSEVIEKEYTLEERENQVQELIKKNSQTEDLNYILEMKQSELQKDNDLLRREIASLKEELDVCQLKLEQIKLVKTNIKLSEQAYKEINKVLAVENEELKMKIRELEEEKSAVPVEIKVDVNEELNRKNFELHLKNTDLKRQVRDSDWTFLMIDHHVQMISFLTNKFREEVLG